MEAVTEQRWEELHRQWVDVIRLEGFDTHATALPSYLDIPTEARRRYPALSWARAAAMAHVRPAEETHQVLTRTLLPDAVALHSDWQAKADTDAALLSATFWLTSQRTAYTVDGGSDDMWRTRNAVAEMIDVRRRAGAPPSEFAAATFHTKSAQLALMRADAVTAVIEADHAVLLDSGPEGHASASLRDVVLELHGTPDPTSAAPGTPSPCPPSLIGHPSSLATLTDLARAIRQLDADAAHEAAASLATLRGEPTWPLRVALTATKDAIWSDPDTAMGQFNDDLGRNVVLSADHHSPLGDRALARARSLLLCKLGSPVEALTLAESIDAPWAWVPLTRARLWAGDLDEAIDTARAGLFTDSRTWAADRVHLSVLKAAAMVANTTRPDGERSSAYARALAVCTASDGISALALLPSFGLEAIMEYHEKEPCQGCVLCDPATVARLAHLSGSRGPAALVKLTPREKDLLPLLSSPAAVPAIARSLHLSVSTVRKQVATLRSKFGATTRQELVNLARSAGHLREDASGV